MIYVPYFTLTNKPKSVLAYIQANLRPIFIEDMSRITSEDWRKCVSQVQDQNRTFVLAIGSSPRGQYDSTNHNQN